MLPYSNGFQPYQNMPVYNQQTYTYNPYQTNQNESQIQMCDSLDFVKSQNVRLDGMANYYALTDGSEIYCKRLNPNTGASITDVYVKKQNVEEPKIDLNTQVATLLSDFKSEIFSEIEGIKKTMLDCLSSNERGGKR